MRWLFVLCMVMVAVGAAVAQVSLPWPGPGLTSVSCTPNTVGGTFADVTHLYHFDNSGTDSSGNGHTLTLGGSASYSTTSPKFGTHSFFGSPAGGFANVGGVWSSYIGGITLEVFLNFTTVSAPQYILGDLNTSFGFSSMVWQFFNSPSQGMQSGGSSSGGITTSPTLSITTGAWHHYAWVRDSAAANIFFYIDGVSQTPLGGTPWLGPVGAGSNGLPAVGAQGQSSATSNWQGYMDEMRVSKVQRYFGNFTPPAAPFCNF